MDQARTVYRPYVKKDDNIDNSNNQSRYNNRSDNNRSDNKNHTKYNNRQQYENKPKYNNRQQYENKPRYNNRQQYENKQNHEDPNSSEINENKNHYENKSTNEIKQNSYKQKSYIQEPVVVPYNEKNKLITDSDIILIGCKHGVQINVNNILIYIQSLTHKSYIKKEYYNMHENILKQAKESMPNVLELRDGSNERLEFLGDTIIKAVVSEYLFERYPEEDEGFMTRLKTKIENQKSLARFSRKIGLDEFIIISSQNEMGIVGRTNDKILEDIFESFIGAMYLDTGFLTCKKFIRYILETEIDYADLIYNDDNFKDQLLRYYHSIKWEHPKYKVLHEEGPPHKRIFTIGVLDNGEHIVGKGIDTSKRRAEQKASKLALYHFGKLNEDLMGDEDIEKI